MPESADEGAEGRTSWRRLWPLAVVLLALAGAYAAGLDRYLSLEAFLDSRQALRAAVDAHPVASIGLYIVLYAILVAIAFPAARHAFGDFLRRRAGGAVSRFAEGFRSDAFSYLLVMRLTPILPFFAVNIAPAFVDISLRTYVLATFLGIIPGSLVYAFLGSGIDQAVANVAHDGPVTIGDLVTTEMTVALFGLCALSVLGLLLKKTFLKGRNPALSDKGL